MVSRWNIPPVQKSCFDGYAVRSEDTIGALDENSISLRLVGDVFPGNAPAKLKIRRGQTAYIATGAPLPIGADAMIKMEEVSISGNEVRIYRHVKAGENLAQIGEDVKLGDLALRNGQVIRLQDIGLLAALWIKKVKVAKKPKVAILSSGDELVELDKAVPNKVVATHNLIIAGFLSELGVTPLQLGIAPDKLGKIRDKIVEGTRKADIVVTIGGAFRGKKDLMVQAINSIKGSKIIVHGVAISPGKDTGLGICRGKPIIVLPGQCVSAISGFYLFVAPLTSLLRGLGTKLPLPTVKATLSQSEEARADMDKFLRVSVKKEDGDNFIAKPIHGGANILTTLVKSNGFVIVSAGRRINKGEEVTVTLFGNSELALI